MKLQVAKWGNSLAVRLPVECIRAAGLREGDSIEASISPAGDIKLSAKRMFDKKAFIDRLSRMHAAMPMTEPVVERMRQEDRY